MKGEQENRDPGQAAKPLKRVAISTLGCKTNQFETAAMTESLARAGCQLVPFAGHADVYVINTCTVTARADADSRRLVRRARRNNPLAQVVVTGCLAQVAPDEVAALEGVDLVVGNAEKRGIAALLAEGDEVRRVIVGDIAQERRAEPLILESFAEHTRAFLQIQNGCDSRCAYCIVPHARGPSRSVPVAGVVEGIGRYVAQGYREIVLTGIHLGAYGRDLDPPTTLHELLAEVAGRGLTRRLRLGSLEPLDISSGLLAVFAGSAMICPHFHIPLQSGSDRILRLMNRGYTRDHFREQVRRLAAAVPDACIGCDVIAGFPGESDADFNDTLTLIEELPLAYLHVFPFSSRPGTAAAALSGKLPPPVVKARAEQLRRLAEEKRRAYNQRFLGRELEVLPLQRERSVEWRGLSRNYLSVAFPGDDSLANSVAMVRVTASGHDLSGIYVGPAEWSPGK